MQNTSLDTFTNSNDNDDTTTETDSVTNTDTSTLSTDSRSEDPNGSVTKTRITTDDRLAVSVIKNQSSKIINGWREAIQNGIDKPNSTLVKLRFNHRYSLIEDDGDPLDFTDKNVEKLLTCLGLSSKEIDDDDTIGQFGVGIGQYIRVGLVTILSGDTSLHFDFKNIANKHRKEPFEDELDARVVPLEKPVDGVRIVIHHYDDEVPGKSSFRWDSYENKIKEHLGYVPLTFDTEVKVNDEVVDEGDPFDDVTRKHRISKETDNAYIAVEHQKDDDIDVYSNGLYVKTIDGEGLAGTIVTKKNLDLELSRDNIKSGCPIWNDVIDELEGLRHDILTTVPDSKLTRNARKAMADRMRNDERTRSDWGNRKVFQLANGEYTSLENVQDESELGFSEQNSHGSEQLIEEGSTVLSQNDPASTVVKDHSDDVEVTSERFDVEEKAKEKGIDTGFRDISHEGKLRPKWRRRVLFARLLADRLGIDREIRWGESDDVDSWTDGLCHITLTESAVDEGRFGQWSQQVYDTVVEMAVYDCDSRKNDFGIYLKEDFYNFHQKDRNQETFFELCQEAQERGFTELYQHYGVSERVEKTE